MRLDNHDDCGERRKTVEELGISHNKIKTFQSCGSERKTFEMEVPSVSDKGKKYIIKGHFVDGDMECSCPGFTFREKCKHLQLNIEKCGWNALESVEPQTIDQKKHHICPRCGGPTQDVARGDF